MITQTSQGAVTVLSLNATLDAELGATLVDRVEELPRGGRPQLVVEISGVGLVDSAGCEALLDARDRVASVGGAAHLAGASPLCRDIFSATGVDEVFEVFDTVNEAVASFAR